MKRLIPWWRKHILDWWSDYSWFILMAAGLVSLALGYIGFERYAAAQDQKQTFLDTIYLTLGLISMNTGAVDGFVNWQLQVARFLIPAITAYTAVKAFTAVFVQQTDRIRIWFVRDQVIICGLGNKGFRLANQFLKQGHPVVVIETDENNPWLESIRASGAMIIQGDAAAPELLKKVKLNRARYLFAVVGDEGVNAEIAVQAEKLSETRPIGTLTCLIHIYDAQLWYLLREKEFDAQENDHFRLSLFNIFHRGAQLMLGDDTPWVVNRAQNTYHLLVIGLGKLGQSLVMEAGLRWRRSPERNNSQLQLSLVDANAKEILHSLTSRFPQLENTVKLNPLEMDIHSADFYQLLNNFQEQGKGSFDHVYICVEDQTLSLHAALNLQKQLNHRETPLTVRMEEGGGLSRLFRGENQANGSYENIKIFDLLEQTCTCELLLKGTHEILARNLHAAYLEGLKKTHDLKGNQEAWVPWEELTLDIQEKNRRQADRIPLVLAAAGYRIDPLMDWDAESFRFSEGEKDRPDDIARMAPVEHELWCQSLKADGYQHGPRRDAKKKTHPNLVPWEQLPPEEIAKNKKYIRDLPRILAKAGFQIIRNRSIQKTGSNKINP